MSLTDFPAWNCGTLHFPRETENSSPHWKNILVFSWCAIYFLLIWHIGSFSFMPAGYGISSKSREVSILQVLAERIAAKSLLTCCPCFEHNAHTRVILRSMYHPHSKLCLIRTALGHHQPKSYPAHPGGQVMRHRWTFLLSLGPIKWPRPFPSNKTSIFKVCFDNKRANASIICQFTRRYLVGLT